VERVVSLLVEGLVQRGIDVTLFATADSETDAKLHAIVPRPYEEDKDLDPKVWECLHISELSREPRSLISFTTTMIFFPSVMPVSFVLRF